MTSWALISKMYTARFRPIRKELESSMTCIIIVIDIPKYISLSSFDCKKFCEKRFLLDKVIKKELNKMYLEISITKIWQNFGVH